MILSFLDAARLLRWKVQTLVLPGLVFRNHDLQYLVNDLRASVRRLAMFSKLRAWVARQRSSTQMNLRMLLKVGRSFV